MGQLYESGSYMVSVSAQGFLPTSTVKDVEAACDSPLIPITLRLGKDTTNTTEENSCSNTTMTITVVDLLTGVPVHDAIVNINLGANVKTDVNGNVAVPTAVNGNYHITATKTGYITADGNKTIACSTETNCSCDTSLTMTLDQPRCDPNTEQAVNLPVIVKDNITNQVVEGALVNLILTNSLSGPSMTPVDQPRYTDTHGTAQFTLSMNGEYSVSITADGYVAQSMPIEVNCNPDHCQMCTPSASITLNQEFCQDKVMKMIVKDSLKNEPVVGAQVKVSIDTFEGAKEVSSQTIGESGEVDVLLIANGLYLTEVSMPGYVLARSSFQINMSSGECDMYHPVELTPLSPETPAGCVRLSLTWGEEPKDLDLYSYRVHKNESEDQCLTYYCNGKDPCNGTAFEVDNKSGGLNGSETITYCSTEEYTNMVYVDDLSGQGASLVNSQARLIIIGSDETQEVALSPSEVNDDNKRYWLAGCLTTTASGTFEFIPVNQFLDIQPNVEEPLHCHNRVAVNNAAYVPLENAKARISAVDALTDEPLEGVLASLSDGSNSQTGLTGSDGTADIPITKNGEYALIAGLDNYVPQRLTVVVNCQDSDCQTDVLVSMLPTNQDNQIQILLKWGDGAEDLDLHVIKVDKNDNRATCETFFNNMNGCKDTSLNHNMKQGGINGSETVTIRQVTSNSMMSYMVFADDNSLTGSSLGTSQADITVTDGTNTIKETIPDFTEDTVAGARYWLAGCVQIVGETFHYVPVNRFSRETPDKLFCDNLLKNTVPTTSEPFCANTVLNIAVHSSLTNLPVQNVSTSVIITKDDTQQTVAESANPDEEGIVKVPISQNGQYVVKVEGPGYIAAKESVNVDCDIARCRDCSPVLLVPVSPLLAPGEVRLTMSWGERPLDLDVYAQQKNINTEEFRSSGVHLTMTNGQVTSSVSMDADRFNGEEHWVAGCVRMVGSSYEFTPVNVFLNSKPDEEIPNLCLE